MESPVFETPLDAIEIGKSQFKAIEEMSQPKTKVKSGTTKTHLVGSLTKRTLSAANRHRNSQIASLQIKTPGVKELRRNGFGKFYQ